MTSGKPKAEAEQTQAGIETNSPPSIPAKEQERSILEDGFCG
jgi:hypothetical protein